LLWRKDKDGGSGHPMSRTTVLDIAVQHFGSPSRSLRHEPVPRGIARSGPAILSYGFRPFFLAAGSFAMIAMVLWIGALSGLWSVGGDEGPIAWHAHEMLFGYASAALGGFVLTAVPNWTGRLPVSGRPLIILLAVWLAGRIASLEPALLGRIASALVDGLFLPALAFVVAREVVAGRNWQNLRVAAGISVLALLNIGFHAVALTGGDPGGILRATVALYVLLVGQVGGRIIPSFTRNYLARAGMSRLPAPTGQFDQLALASALAAGIAWSLFPEGWPTALLGVIAAGLHAVRLARWRGAATWREPLLAVMHVGYAFIPIGYLAVALSSVGLLSAPSALHVLTVGVIGLMTVAVMTRATRGHTGRPLRASRVTTASYLCLLATAVLRPIAELAPDYSHPILVLSAVGWIAAYGLFVAEHAPMLARPTARRTSSHPGGQAV
jgi:uncharacterized protein involved in response to NO